MHYICPLTHQKTLKYSGIKTKKYAKRKRFENNTRLSFVRTDIHSAIHRTFDLFESFYGNKIGNLNFCINTSTASDRSQNNLKRKTNLRKLKL